MGRNQMQVVTTVEEVRRARRELLDDWGLVPTMGFLHAGHLSLVERARVENDSVAVSIFVNPTQFGPSEDLSSYPRDLERDLSLLHDAGADVVWTPSAEEVFPHGYQTFVEVESVTQRLEGAARPGHFRGVATVVAKLFNVFQPQRAYFGQKDAQQVAVIRRMARDLNFPLEVIVCPTMREPDGLAMSSRNSYLSAEERMVAPVLYRALSAARNAWESGERDGEQLRRMMSAVLAEEPLARPEYVSVADPGTFDELGKAEGEAVLSLAVRIGRARLIDNILVGGP